MIKIDDKLVLWRLANKVRRENGLPELSLGEFQVFLKTEFHAAVLKAGK